MTDDSNTEIKRIEWSQGAFIEVWDDGEQLACVPEDEAQRIGAKAGMVPITKLEQLIEEWSKQHPHSAHHECARELREVLEDHD